MVPPEIQRAADLARASLEADGVELAHMAFVFQRRDGMRFATSWPEGFQAACAELLRDGSMMLVLSAPRGPDGRPSRG